MKTFESWRKICRSDEFLFVLEKFSSPNQVDRSNAIGKQVEQWSTSNPNRPINSSPIESNETTTQRRFVVDFVSRSIGNRNFFCAATRSAVNVSNSQRSASKRRPTSRLLSFDVPFVSRSTKFVASISYRLSHWACFVRCQIDDLDDFLLVRRIEEFHNEKGTLECRACTSNDRAVAHCSTCFDYLCLKCCQAHQYMKCFEQHQVRYLKERDEKDLSSANNKADELEQIRSNFDKLHRSVDEQRSLCLSTLDQKLTDLHKIYQENKEKIESVHRSLQKIIDDVQVRFCARSLLARTNSSIFSVRPIFCLSCPMFNVKKKCI